MKQCPACKSVYTDDTLSFCLNDGAALQSAPSTSSEITQQLHYGSSQTRENHQPIRVEFQTESPTQFSIPKNTNQTQNKGINPLAVALAIILIGIIGIAGIAIAYFAFVKTENPKIVSKTDPQTTVAPQNINSNETQKLKEELEKLKKQVETQKNAKTNSSVSPTIQQPLVARVDSPNDGFLALRSSPSAKTGAQLLQIPHGAIVAVNGCQGYTTIGKRRGRWCRVSYGGQEGWAFDGFLIY